MSIEDLIPSIKELHKGQNGGHSGALMHLSDEDKQIILFEISWMMSEAGWIDGLVLFDRFESLFKTYGGMTKEEKRHILEHRPKR